MKRFWLGIALAVILFISGIWVGSYMNDTGTSISTTLKSAAEEALSGNSQIASDLVEEAHKEWEQVWHKVAAVADHSPMDEIDGLFAQLMVYADAGTADEFAAYCQRISQLVLAVGEAHSFNWWNLL